jgi:UDPglucose 6-dehydrogenase
VRATSAPPHEIAEALTDAETVILAVGTPSENGVIDLKYIRAASARNRLYPAGQGRSSLGHREIHGRAGHHRHGRPRGDRGRLRQDAGEGFGLGMNPEFLREGEAIEDFMEPDRIVLGHEDEKTLMRLRALYAPWDVDKLEVNTRTAEMIKYANNCLLATQISAVNEIANLAAAVGGIDVMDVMAGVHLDKRWNPILGRGTRAGRSQDPDLPDPGLRLRRIVLPQGRAGAALPGRGRA